MKKTLKAALTVATALAFGCAAVACGEDNEKPQEPNQYTVSYALGAGVTGTAPVGGKYKAGATFEVAALPSGITNAGHTFDGWSDGTAKYAAGATYTMPAHNVTFTAQWNPEIGEVTYSVTYDLNGGKGTTPTEENKAEGATFKLASSDGLSKDGFIFGGWSDGTTMYDAGATYTIKGADVTFAARWTPELRESVEFAGNCTLPTQSTGIGDPETGGSTVEGGETVVGIRINGETNKAYFKLQGQADYTESKYCEDISTSKYKPVGDIYGVADGVDLPTKNYGADAYYFEIQIGDGSRHYNILIKSDLSNLYICNTDDAPLTGGEFVKVESSDPGNTEVTVTFDLGYSGIDVVNPASQTVTKGGKLTAFDNPTRNGYTFGGWHVGSADGAAFDIVNDVVNDSMTLVAKWTPVAAKPIATFVAPDGATGNAPEAIEMTEGAKFPQNTFVKEGYEFQGWTAVADDGTTNGTLYQPDANMNWKVNKTFKAVFGKAYKHADAPNYYPSLILRDDGYVTQKSGDSINGYFEYTYNNGLYTYVDESSSYYTVITFKIDGEKYIQADGWQDVDITADDGVTKLVFDGFGNCTLGANNGTYEPLGGVVTLTFGSDVFRDLEYEMDFYGIPTSLLAKFTLGGVEYSFGNPVTVTFNLGEGVEGTAPAAQTIASGKKAKEPTTPTREGYLFKAWRVGTVDGAVFDFDNAVTADTVLVAEWATPVTVTFSLGDGVDGTAPAAQRIAQGNTATAPKAPTRTGYTFKAWHVGTVDGEVFDFSTAVNSDITLVAEWEVKVMGALLYDFAEEGASNAIKYGYDDAASAADSALVVANNDKSKQVSVYKADAYYTSAGKLTVKIYYMGSSREMYFSTTKLEDGIADVNDKTLPGTQIIKVKTSATYDNKFITVSFSMNNGKRQMTLTLDDVSVTWTEMAA